MKEFNKWFSEYKKTSSEYSDRDICKDAFRAGMYAVIRIVESTKDDEHGLNVAENEKF